MTKDWRTPLAVVAALVVGLMLLPGPAGARPQDGIKQGSGHVVAMPGTGDGWYGAYHVGEITAYCTDLNSGPPREASAWTELTGYDLHKQHGWGGPRLPHGNSAAVASDEELAQLAWVLHETGSSPSPDVAAAVEHMVRTRTIDGTAQQDREAARWAAVTRAHPGALAAFTALDARARELAGPYTLDVSWFRRPNVGNLTGEVHVTVLSAAGRPVPEVHVTTTASGELEITSPARPTDADGSTRTWVRLPAPTASAVAGALAVTIEGLAPTRPRLFVPAESTIQRMVAAAAPVTLSWQDQVTVEPAPWTPTVTTRTRDVIATPGAEAVDIITVRDGRPGSSFTGSTTLYGPFASTADLAAADPATAPVVGTAHFEGTWDDNGDAEVHSTALEYPETGYFMWVETLDASPLVIAPGPPEWPQESETSVVVAPVLTSELIVEGEPEEVLPGVRVTDSLQLSGVPEGRTVPGSSTLLEVQVSGVLLGPVAPARIDDELSCSGLTWEGAPEVARYDGVVMGTDTLTGLLPAELPEPGCYTAAASLALTHDGLTVASFEHPPGLPAQSVLVQSPPEPEPEPEPTPDPTPTPEPTPPVETSPAPDPTPDEPGAPAPPTPDPGPGTEPRTPRINSGSPVTQVRWALVAAGLALTAASLALGNRSRGRRS